MRGRNLDLYTDTNGSYCAYRLDGGWLEHLSTGAVLIMMLLASRNKTS
jgi:hypothetical protein